MQAKSKWPIRKTYLITIHFCEYKTVSFCLLWLKERAFQCQFCSSYLSICVSKASQDFACCICFLLSNGQIFHLSGWPTVVKTPLAFSDLSNGERSRNLFLEDIVYYELSTLGGIFSLGNALLAQFGVKRLSEISE